MARDLKQRDEMILRLNREKEAAALQVRELRKALDAILRQLDLCRLPVSHVWPSQADLGRVLGYLGPLVDLP